MKIHSVMLAVVMMFACSSVLAADVYLEPETFLSESFDGDVPKPKVLWLRGDTRKQVKQILGHSGAGLRVRYWARDARSVWILEEIGKTEPITTGLVVEDGALERIQVLIYRESRGWEVRYPFFTDQFHGATLTDLNRMNRLDRPINGISGATLSVRALTNLARMALFLHGKVMSKEKGA